MVKVIKNEEKVAENAVKQMKSINTHNSNKNTKKPSFNKQRSNTNTVKESDGETYRPFEIFFKNKNAENK